MRIRQYKTANWRTARAYVESLSPHSDSS